MITREELYELVWTKAAMHVAADLGVSGSYLGRVCIALNVPRPPRGYWMLKLAGKAPSRPSLPPIQFGHPDRWSKNGEGTPPIQRFHRHPALDAWKHSDLHPLAAEAATVFGSAVPKSGDTVLRTKAYIADLTTSPAALDRAISLLNGLLTALNDEGHDVEVTPQPNFIRPALAFHEPSTSLQPPRKIWTPLWPTIAKIRNTPVGLAILETHKAVEMRYVDGRFSPSTGPAPKNAKRIWGITWTEHQWMPTGRLKLVAYSPIHFVRWQREWMLDGMDATANGFKTIVRELEEATRTLAEARLPASHVAHPNGAG